MILFTFVKMVQQTSPTIVTHVQASKINKIDYQRPSEDKPYPELQGINDLSIVTDISDNRTYLKAGKKTIYTMYSSAGKIENGKSTTPTGTFYVEPERGESFFHQELQEGANYWVSFKNHGEYLFHTVPTKGDGSYNQKEAAKLGKQPASHGCIRLSAPDAKYLYENLPTGTKVIIRN